jgi:hypothetical protein
VPLICIYGLGTSRGLGTASGAMYTRYAPVWIAVTLKR